MIKNDQNWLVNFRKAFKKLTFKNNNRMVLIFLNSFFFANYNEINLEEKKNSNVSKHSLSKPSHFWPKVNSEFQKNVKKKFWKTWKKNPLTTKCREIIHLLYIKISKQMNHPSMRSLLWKSKKSEFFHLFEIWIDMTSHVMCTFRLLKFFMID